MGKGRKTKRKQMKDDGGKLKKKKVGGKSSGKLNK